MKNDAQKAAPSFEKMVHHLTPIMNSAGNILNEKVRPLNRYLQKSVEKSLQKRRSSYPQKPIKCK